MSQVIHYDKLENDLQGYVLNLILRNELLIIAYKIQHPKESPAQKLQ